jgi:hypothetical protein
MARTAVVASVIPPASERMMKFLTPSFFRKFSMKVAEAVDAASWV